MREHPSFWFKSLGVVCFSAAVLWTVPDLAAQRFGAATSMKPASPLDESAVEEVGRQLRVPGVMRLAGVALVDARSSARFKTIEVSDDMALGAAHQAFMEDHAADAERILRVLISHREAQLKGGESGGKKQAARQQELYQAQFLLAHTLTRQNKQAEAAELLGELSGKTPVEDFVQWLRGHALRRAGKPAEAAKALQAAFDQDTTLVKLHAQVELAHALSEAERWKEALPVLEQVIEAFPDYPRRYQLLYFRAEALEHLGRLDEAARAYQKTWFEFPHKSEGEKAQKAMARLAKTGHAAAPIEPRQLFERYRTLRVNKHWELAESLFKELMAEHKTPGGHSAFEHEILTQLVLNDYVPQRNEETMAWLQILKKEYEDGYTAGIDRNLLYRYLSRTYSRLGDFDRALAALDTQTQGWSRTSQLREKAQFLEEHGRYQAAKQIYDEIESKWKKLGWHYTWLLYKTGEFQQAYQNLTRLAERARGQRRAKYMYWAARTLALDGNVEEATKLYADIAESYESGYYGIQAHNRLLDIQQGRSVDDRVISEARSIVDGASQVLAMMDQAGEANTASDAASYRDPRTVPRTGNPAAPAAKSSSQDPADRALIAEDKAGEPAKPPQIAAAAATTIDCQAESAEERQFCELLTGQTPDRARGALETALAPYLPYTSLMGSGTSVLTTEELAAALDDDVADQPVELGDDAGEDAPPPRRNVVLSAHAKSVARGDYDTQGRIYWEGRRDSPVAFINAENGQVIGPMPAQPTAYDEVGYQDGLERAIAAAGDLFPQLARAKWLRDAGYVKYARWAIRDLAIEYDGLSSQGRPSTKPVELSTRRWAYLIDNRRQGSGVWGYRSAEPRYPVPGPGAARQALLKRQQQIYDRRAELDPLVMDALKDVGDYHMVRKFNFGTGPWYREDPTGVLRGKWMQAYPRAFPRKVIRESIKNGVNPYLVWAVMTVESTYNPDSISYADALGLLQVIPRTGIKTAEMLGDEAFGPMDLLNEDVAIRHGAFYLSKLVNKFRGQELLAIAGYNGGPHRVSAWMDKRGRNMPLDEFVEEIPFDQARGYTKKVTRYLALYLRIYEGVDHLYIGQKMRLDHLPDPNF